MNQRENLEGKRLVGMQKFLTGRGESLHLGAVLESDIVAEVS
jgi:hypothetical protein